TTATPSAPASNLIVMPEPGASVDLRTRRVASRGMPQTTKVRSLAGLISKYFSTTTCELVPSRVNGVLETRTTVAESPAASAGHPDHRAASWRARRAVHDVQAGSDPAALTECDRTASPRQHIAARRFQA